MNFELGKSYIVNVTENGIVPSMEFDRNQWFNKDYDDLEFLTDEEKEVVVNDVLDKIRADIERAKYTDFQRRNRKTYDKCLEIIEKYTAESEGSDADIN